MIGGYFLKFDLKLFPLGFVVIFLLAVLFVFLLLTAQYESWGLPFAVILTVPLCLVGAIWGVKRPAGDPT